MATETTSSEEEQEFPVPSSYGSQGMLGVGGVSRVHAESPMDGRAMRRSSRGSFTRASLEDLLSIDPEAYQSSVWLGTEDGWCVELLDLCTQAIFVCLLVYCFHLISYVAAFVSIHVYQSSDNIRNRKNSMKMQHSASILCILWVCLANFKVIENYSKTNFKGQEC